MAQTKNGCFYHCCDPQKPQQLFPFDQYPPTKRQFLKLSKKKNRQHLHKSFYHTQQNITNQYNPFYQPRSFTLNLNQPLRIHSFGVSHTKYQGDTLQVRMKRSSLYHGAKRIIFGAEGKESRDDQELDYNYIVHEPRQVPITSSFAKSERETFISSPQRNYFETISINKAAIKKELETSSLKIRQLGIGKITKSQIHIAQNGFIFTHKRVGISQIIDCGGSVEIFLKNICFYQNLHTPRVLQIYTHTKSSTEFHIISQFYQQNLTSILDKNGPLDATKAKIYLRQIIQGIVCIHDHEAAHGNLNCNQIIFDFDQCKIKPSFFELTKTELSSSRYLQDIHNIALIGYKMIFGLGAIFSSQQANKLMIEDDDKKNLVDFVSMLMSLDKPQRLTESFCFSHKLFCGL